MIPDVAIATQTCRLVQPGCVDYATAWEWQRQLVVQRSQGACADTLLVLEHPPTITLGRKADHAHVLVAAEELAREGVTVVQTDRGGDVTYHAPGQVVGYPIFKLSRHGSDLGRYMRNLEAVIIGTLATYGIVGNRVPGLTGVWVDDGRAKVAAIGVKLSASGVTCHGFALNVDPDMRGFAQIVPCGITDRTVTSLEQLLGVAPPLADVTNEVLRQFATIFDVALTRSTLAEM